MPIAKSHHRCALAALTLFSAAGAHAQTEFSADWSPDGNQVVFVRVVAPGEMRLFAQDTGTGEERNLTPSPGLWDRDFLLWSAPRWSPDGEYIAFSYGRGPAEDIGIMRADGSGVRRLSENFVFDGWPSWSPDGSRLVFSSARNSPDDAPSPFFSDLYILTLATGEVERVTATPGYSEDLATFSEDGTSIIYSAREYGANGLLQSHLEILDLASSDVTPLTSADNWFDISPRFERSTGRVVFSSNRSGNFELYALDRQSLDITQLTHTPYDEFDPVPIAPQKLGIIADYAGDTDVVELRTDTGTRDHITNNSSFDGHADLSGDGTRLVYVSHRSGERELHERNLVSGDDHVLFSHTGIESHPRFSPDGRFVAFALGGSLDEPDAFSAASQIIVLDRQTGHSRQLTDDAYQNVHPEWSGDGRNLVYVANDPASGVGEIRVIPATGGTAESVTDIARPMGRAVWGRDDAVLYAEGFDETDSSRGRTLWAIYEINLSTGQQTRLTDAVNHHDFAPQYSRQRDQLVFVSTRDSNRELYVMNTDGSGVTRRTNTPAFDHFPRWASGDTALLFQSDRNGDMAIFMLDLATGSVSSPTDTR